MIEIPFYLTIVDGEGGLQTKSFLLGVDVDPATYDIINRALRDLSRKVIAIPSYSLYNDTNNHAVKTSTYEFYLADRLYIPPVNFIGTLAKTVESLIRIFLFKELEEAGISRRWEDLKVSEFVVADAIPLEFVYDNVRNYAPVPFVRWTHSDLYRPTCFSCQQGVTELMRAINYCKGQIVTDKGEETLTKNIVVRDYFGSPIMEFQGRKGVIMLDESDDIQNEFVNWFTSSFQGTLETAHIQMIEFICPQRTISRNLGY